MKYIAAYLALCSLNSFASQNQAIKIENKSGHTITAYYTLYNGYQFHQEIPTGETARLTIKTPSKELPQSIALHWNGCKKQKTFHLTEGGYYPKITIKPALRIVKDRKCMGIIKDSSSSESHD